MPLSAEKKSFELFRTAALRVAPFASNFMPPIGPGSLILQNVQTDASGRLEHAEGVDKKGSSAIVLDLSYSKRTFTVSTGSSADSAKPEMIMTVSPTPTGGRKIEIVYPSNPSMNLECDVESKGHGRSTALSIHFRSGQSNFSGSLTKGSNEKPPVFAKIENFMSTRPRVRANHDDPSLLFAFAPQLQKRFNPAGGLGGGQAVGPVSVALLKCLVIGILGDLLCGLLCGVVAHVICDEGKAEGKSK